MAGKYVSVIGNLERLPTERSERVKEKVSALRGQRMEVLGETYVDLRAEKKAAEEVLSEIEERLAAVEFVLVDSFEAGNISSIKIFDRDKTISHQKAPHATVQDKQALREWCLNNNMGDELTLPWQTLNALSKELLLSGQPEPDGVKLYSRDTLVLR